MIETLTKLWEKGKTRKFVKIFKQYTKNQGITKWDGRKKDNHNTYYTDGESCNWNKVHCIHYGTGTSDEKLRLVLRKEAGDYMIIAYEGKRIFEVDHRGVIEQNITVLNMVFEKYKELFDALVTEFVKFAL